MRRYIKVCGNDVKTPVKLFEAYRREEKRMKGKENGSLDRAIPVGEFFSVT